MNEISDAEAARGLLRRAEAFNPTSFLSFFHQNHKSWCRLRLKLSYPNNWVKKTGDEQHGTFTAVVDTKHSLGGIGQLCRWRGICGAKFLWLTFSAPDQMWTLPKLWLILRWLNQGKLDTFGFSSDTNNQKPLFGYMYLCLYIYIFLILPTSNKKRFEGGTYHSKTYPDQHALELTGLKLTGHRICPNCRCSGLGELIVCGLRGVCGLD